ncbi:MAG: flippase-like domain-containing protein [Methanomicrobiales archaeon]|nr:flippase-like domain-containing protein [Methanomicrobiales archaeon]
MWKRISGIVIPAVIAGGILIYMLYQVRDSLPAAIATAIPQYLILALIIAGFTWFVRGLRYVVILDGLAIRITTMHSTAMVLLSQTANLVVPARLGDLVRMFILKDQGRATYSQGLSSLVVERIFDVVMVALLGFLSLNFVFNVPGWFFTVITIPLVGGGIFVALLYVMGMLESDNRYIKMVLRLMQEVRQASLGPRSLAILSLTSIFIWMMDILVCVVVILMFRQEVVFPVVVLAIAIGNLVKAVPITPGGIGTYEAALAITFSLAGMPAVTATLIAIIDHLIKNVVTAVGGLASLYFFKGQVVQALKKAFRVRVSGEESLGD